MSTVLRASCSPGSLVRSRPRTARTALWFTLVSASLGCTTAERPEGGAQATEAPPSQAPASAAGQLGLGDVMRRVHFAFRPEGDSFRGGHTTYAVRADARSFEVAPYQPTEEDSGRDAVKGAAFVATLTSIERGGVSLQGARDARADLDPSARVAITHGDVVEHLENTEQGVEQSFSFAKKPEGRGDLEVRIAVSGEIFTKETETGLHFVDPATGLGVRYGVATWIDARGQKTSVPVDFEAGHIVLRVPERALDEGAFPAVLDPVIGPEFGIDGVIQGGAAGTQTESAVAYGGGNYLVVWRDARTGTDDLYGVRVSSTGTILDTSGIVISNAAGIQQKPDIAFDGTNWMVTWTDQRQDAQGDIYAARVSSSGAVLDPDGIPVATVSAMGGEGPAAVAFGSTHHLVAYRRSYGLYGRLIAPDGTMTPEFTFASSNTYIDDISIAFNGANYLVVFDNLNASTSYVHGRRVSPSGTVLDASNLTICSYCTTSDLDVASDGTNWFAVWRDSGIYGQRITNAGAILDTSSGKYLAESSSALSVAFAGNGYGVFGTTSNEIYGLFVDSLGNVTIPKTALIAEPGSSSMAAAAHDGTNFFLAFTDTRQASSANPSDVFGLRVSNTFTKVDATSQLLSRAANAQARPAVAYNGTNYLAVWEDRRPGTTTDIYGARLTTSGAVLDPSGIAISQATGSEYSPSVASLGTDWLVAWTDGRAGNDDVYATRVSGTGSALDPSGLPIATATGSQSTPAVSSDGTNWLVTWQDAVNAEIWASRVSPAATVLDGSGIQISTGGGSSPAVAYNGTNYLVAWSRPGAMGYDVAAARLTPAGAVLDTGNFAINVAATSAPEYEPSVTSNGVEWLVAWYTSSDVRGARVGSTGAVLDPMGIGISTAANTQRTARAVWDGTQYWVVWQDDRAVSGRQDIYGARLTPGGVVTDTTGIVLANDPAQNELTPAIAAGPSKEALLVYQRFDTAQPHGADRVWARLVSDPTLGVNGVSCQTGAQCASGSCVDGVCCDTGCNGACVACTATKKGGGLDGECGPITMGSDPDNECANQAASSCGTTGSCNGAGACQLHAQGTPCGAVCVGDSAQSNTCNGMGTCAAAGTATSCAPYACVAGACNTTCTANADCTAGNVCVGGVCGELEPNGAACTSDVWCQSGACVDGVCCNTACTGLCEACTTAKKGAGANGVCGPIASGTDPENECALEAAGSCGQNGQCNGAGACQLHAQGTSCGASLCQGTIVKGQICDGMGQCVSDPAGKECAPYVCSAGSCKNPCANDNECLSGTLCIGGACKPPGMPGVPCSTGAACSSGFCVDGVCCDTACEGSCEACTAAKKGQGADGQCQPIKMGTDPDDECAAQPPSSCGLDGQCNGAGDCAMYAAGTPCAAGSCEGTTQTNPSQCDGSGTCAPGTQASCVEGYACVANKCATSCTDDTACAPGYVCNVAMKWCEPMAQAGSSSSSGTGGGASSSSAGGSNPGAGGSNPGAGGSNPGAGGAGGVGGDSSGSGGRDSTGDEGCGCKVAGAPRAESLAPSALIAWALGIVLRRRVRRNRKGHGYGSSADQSR
ncbi:hypothetical protein [Polyangium mundeleinium]|uniref:Disintegrin domain-containing protein n=1 Tax=Polyangium mundeleinium TaxID=2995306 RepID=A0ABT5EV23_9BACT|nr:hypothetical protein [Polyangium mundeleinium]MDC0745680.1 hypothetical protein [Polyangium mundeleinium]